MSAAGGSHNSNLYIVELVFGFKNMIMGRKNVQVLEFKEPNSAQFQILIGRDIICSGALTISSDCHYSFSL